MSAAELATTAGIGFKHATKVTAAIEAVRHLLSEPLERGATLGSAEDVFEAYGHRLRDLRRESIWAVYLDTKSRVICDELVAVGGIDQCSMSPGDVLRTALKVGARSVIVLHNHPSGVPTPSPDDDALTKELRLSAKLVGLDLLDHVIIGDGSYFSYAGARRLP